MHLTNIDWNTLQMEEIYQKKIFFYGLDILIMKIYGSTFLEHPLWKFEFIAHLPRTKGLGRQF